MNKIPYITLLLMTIIMSGCITTKGGTRNTVMPRVTTSPHFSSAVYDRIAIYVVDYTRRQNRYTRRLNRTGKVREVEDEFMRVLLERGYTLAARSDMAQINKELDLQSSNITEAAIARKAKALNVSAIIIVSINDVSISRYQPIIRQANKRYYQSTASISARMISAELAQVVWLSSHKGNVVINDKNNESIVIPKVARIVASGLPARTM